MPLKGERVNSETNSSKEHHQTAEVGTERKEKKRKKERERERGTPGIDLRIYTNNSTITT